MISIFGDLTSLYIIICIFFLMCIVVGITAIYLNYKHRKRLEELTLYQIHTSVQIDESIPEILNLIIQESFTDYKVKYLIPLQEGFINSTREAEIRKELVALVTYRISNAALDKISLFYNISNIADILADKIYIIVMNYVLEHNTNLVEK